MTHLLQLFSRDAYKIFFLSLIILCAFSNQANTLLAETLNFKSGQTAIYQICENIKLESSIFGFESEQQSTSKLILEIELIKDNDCSYPFLVQVIVKDITNDKEVDVESALCIQKLFGYPLQFLVKEPFMVEEQTGRLAEVYDQLGRNSEEAIFGTTPWCYELLLTQLFHLAGEELDGDHARIPVNGYQLLNWEDEKIEDADYDIIDTGCYDIQNVSESCLKGEWSGEAKVKGKDADHWIHMEGHTCFSGSVVWDKHNPLIQERFFSASLQEKATGIVPMTARIEVTQYWQPIT